jgi:hypothetical protein
VSDLEDLDARPRLEKIAAMNQQPKDRLWAAIIVLAIIALLSGGITIVYSETTRNFLDDGRQLGFQRGAVECMQVVVDNDRTFDLPSYCRLEEVVFYYHLRCATSSSRSILVVEGSG